MGRGVEGGVEGRRGQAHSLDRSPVGFLQGWENQLGPIVLWILRSVKHKCENALSVHFKFLDGSKVLTGFRTSNGLGSGFIVIGDWLSICNNVAA